MLFGTRELFFQACTTDFRTVRNVAVRQRPSQNDRAEFFQFVAWCFLGKISAGLSSAARDSAQKVEACGGDRLEVKVRWSKTSGLWDTNLWADFMQKQKWKPMDESSLYEGSTCHKVGLSSPSFRYLVSTLIPVWLEALASWLKHSASRFRLSFLNTICSSFSRQH